MSRFNLLELEGQQLEPDREEARHWVAVYGELIGTCRQVIGDGPGAAFREDPEDRSHVATRLHEFEERRAFWMELLRE